MTRTGVPRWLRPAGLVPIVLGFLHLGAVWVGMGGGSGVGSPWPLARHDHPLYFHSALVTRAFLRQTGTTAGYDPSFMAGYAKSIVFPASSTLPELVVAGFGGGRPVLAYKLYVLVSTAALPWLLWLAGRRFGLPSGAVAWAVALFLIYLWTDFPIQYATFGMVPYLLGVPLSLLVAGVLARYLARGGTAWWVLASLGCALAVLVHLTTVMVLVPTALLMYLVAVLDAPGGWRGYRASRHLGVWLIPAVVLAINAFWWWPAIWLSGTKGASDFAFAHPEGVLARLGKILTTEPPVQALLWAVGIPGLVVMMYRDRVAASGLLGLVLGGFFWGYGAGAFRGLDFLQPGRHTYVLYSTLTLAGGLFLAETSARLRVTRPRLDRWFCAGLVLVGVRQFGPPLTDTVALNLGNPLPVMTRLLNPALAESLRRLPEPPEPFLSSRPTARLRWVVDRVRSRVRPGERLLYEEGGFTVAGLRDPFGDGRFSGLIPYFAPGVEVLGGPYLHAALLTNFTQFGEGKLFGVADWGRADFVRYARIYRPAAILCWSPRARAFCRDNPDLVEILDDDGALLFGRVRGFGGATIRGEAVVAAGPGRLSVRGRPGELDGMVVLRYHFVPCMRSLPPTRLEPVFLEGDPVPFIGLRPPSGTATLRLVFPPAGG